MNFLRRLRGVAATATIWALGWAGIATPMFFVLLPHLRLAARLAAALRMAGYAGLAGAVVGATTATLVTLFEHRATFAQLRARRIGISGAVSGAGYFSSLILLSPTSRIESLSVVIAAGVVGGVLGGASALLTLLLAREADRRGAGHGPGLFRRSHQTYVEVDERAAEMRERSARDHRMRLQLT